MSDSDPLDALAGLRAEDEAENAFDEAAIRCLAKRRMPPAEIAEALDLPVEEVRRAIVRDQEGSVAGIVAIAAAIFIVTCLIVTLRLETSLLPEFRALLDTI